MKIFLSCVFIFLLGSSVFAQNKLDSKGKKQGPWQKYYPKTSIIEYKGEFKDDLPIGKFIYKYPTNKLKAEIVHKEKGRSECIMYHEDGKTILGVGIFINQQKDSTWTMYDSSGKLSTTENYKVGKLHGERTVYVVPMYIEDKTQKVAKISNYVDGLENGETIEYFQNGTIKSKTNYSGGKKNGIAYVYNVNSTIMTTERWKNGVQHGWQSGHDGDGKEIGKVLFKNGVKLIGKELDTYLALCKKKGIDPNK